MESNSLLKILEETIITEGRVEKVLEKYKGKIQPDIVNKFVEAQNRIDRSIDNKYLEWMVREYILSPQKLDEIISTVEKWHNNLAKIDIDLIADTFADMAEKPEILNIKNAPKDINSYKNLAQLKKITDAAVKKLSRKDLDEIIRQETRLVYNDNQFEIRVPLTHRASCKYGSGTKWCVAAKDNDSHFKSYTRDGILFFIVDKNKPNMPEHPLYKVAVLMNKNDGKVTIWNAPDTNIGTDLKTFFPPQMIDAMESYRKKYVVDLTKLGNLLNVELQNTKLNISGWKLTGNANGSWFDGENYKIDMQMKLKDGQITFILKPKVKETTALDGETMEIPGELVKDVEDIFVEYGYHKEEMKVWTQRLAGVISDKLQTEILPSFTEPILQNNVAVHVNSLLKSKSIPHWDYKIENLPTASSKKLEIKAVRSIKDPEDGVTTEYTFKGFIDFNKGQFVFTAIENYGTKSMEEYDDQILPFPKGNKNEFKNTPEKVAASFINWIKDITEAVIDVPEDKTAWPPTQAKPVKAKPINLKTIPGKYDSDGRGEFNVELDDSKQIHVYAPQIGGHFLIKTPEQFLALIDRYGLTKK